MATEWQAAHPSGNVQITAHEVDGTMRIALVARPGYVFDHAGVVQIGLTVRGARALAATLTEWAVLKEPKPPDVVRFKQLLDELNDLAVALAAERGP